MPADPIREALREACEWMHANCGEAESVEAWRHDAAGTIAAFLRALDGQYIRGTTGALAAAVERAAREGGDG